MTFTSLILTIASVLTALSAGFFFTWSVSIVSGLGRLSDVGYISAMQAINRAVQNPLFFLVFFGPTILLPFASFLNYAQTTRFRLLIVASVIYLGGVIGVTVLGNVPMNNKLDAFDPDSATNQTMATERTNYEGRWNTLNHIRTVSSTLSIVLVIIACLKQD